MEASPLASGEKAKARDILAAIRTLKQIEQEHRPATPGRTPDARPLRGFWPRSPAHLSRSASPAQYKDAAWQALGRGAARHCSRPRNTTRPSAPPSTPFIPPPPSSRPCTRRLPAWACPRTPPCWNPAAASAISCARHPRACASSAWSWTAISGRIARALHPGQDIRIENFRDTRLPEDRIDAVIGNVPFADVKLDYHGQKLSLHDYFFAKSIDALKPGGVLAPGHVALHARQAECRESASTSPRRPTSWARSACPPMPSSGRARQW